MPNNFEVLMNNLEQQWDEKIVVAFDRVKKYLLEDRVPSTVEAEIYIKKLSDAYHKFFSWCKEMVNSCVLTRSQTMVFNNFCDTIKLEHSTDMKELCDLYNNRIEPIRNYFFQKNCDRLPLPTFEEQWNAWEIFPSDPKTHPQYYTYDFK